MAGRLAQTRLDSGDRAERRVDLRVRLAHGRAEHVGVLAHLERCEVEPERAHLFGEVGQLPIGKDRRAAGAERRTKGLQVSLEGIDVGSELVPCPVDDPPPPRVDEPPDEPSVDSSDVPPELPVGLPPPDRPAGGGGAGARARAGAETVGADGALCKRAPPRR